MEAEVEFTRAAPGEALAVPISELQVFWFGWGRDIYCENSHLKRATKKPGWRFPLLCTSGLFLPCCTSSCWEDAQPSTGSTRAKFQGKQRVWHAGVRREHHVTQAAVSTAQVQRCSPCTALHSRLSPGRIHRWDQQGPRGLSTTCQPSSPPPHSLPSSSLLRIRADAEVQQRSGKNIFLVTAKPVLALTHQQQKK